MTVEIPNPSLDAESSTATSSTRIELVSPAQSTSDSCKQNISINSPSTENKSSDEHFKSPHNETDVSSSSQDLTINCTTAQATPSNNSSGSSTSISPISKSFSTPDVDTRKYLKRNRDSSCESESRPKSASTESQKSPVNDMPPTKVAKVSYSIMNILGNKESQIEGKNHKSTTENTQSHMPQDIAGIIQQQIMAAAAGGNNLSQFMMNPFLAAAAAFSSTGGGSQQHPSQMPWFNIPALYGFDKGFNNNNKSELTAAANEQQNIKFHTQQNQRKFNYSESPNSVRTSSPAGTEYTNNDSNAQLQHRFGQFMNNILHQQHHYSNDARENTSSLLIKSEHNHHQKPSSNNASSDSSNSILSSPLSVSPSNQAASNQHRYMIDNDRRHNDIIDRKNGFGEESDENDDNLDDEDLDDEDIDENGDSFENGNRKKKTRTVFSRNQVFQLESTFDMKRYLSSSERSSLANSLQLTETQIKIWFQNRRNKWKRQLAAEIEANTNVTQQTSSATNIPINNNQHHIDSNNRAVFQRANSQAGNNTSRISHLPGHYANEIEQLNNHLASSGSSSSLSSSSTRSSLSSPSQNTMNLHNSLNNATAVLNNLQQHGHNIGHFNHAALTPQILAAAAAASSLYFAAAGVPSQGVNPGGFNLSQFAALGNVHISSNNPKQSLSGII